MFARVAIKGLCPSLLNARSLNFKLVWMCFPMERRESSLVFLPIGFEKFPGAKAGIWYRCPNAFLSRYPVCIRKNTRSPAPCHSQGSERKSARRLEAAGGPSYSTLINPLTRLALWSDPVACLFGTFLNNFLKYLFIYNAYDCWHIGS